MEAHESVSFITSLAMHYNGRKIRSNYLLQYFIIHRYARSPRYVHSLCLSLSKYTPAGTMTKESYLKIRIKLRSASNNSIAIFAYRFEQRWLPCKLASVRSKAAFFFCIPCEVHRVEKMEEKF
jgi:hypothetical protein